MATMTVYSASRATWHSSDLPRAALFTLLLVFVFGFLSSPLQAAEESGGGQTVTQEKPMEHGNPIANYWRTVREGQAGITTESGPYTSNVLIQNGGQNWRQIRNGLIVNYGGWLLGIVLLVIFLFFLVRGRVRVEAGYSGKRVVRFSPWQRIVHWYTAVTFILLGLSGLTMLFGRAVLIPLLGKDAFSALAELSKTVHNFTGPLFVVAVLMLIVTFVAANLPREGDLKWLLSGGGMLRGRHASAGFFNVGEKLWFWLASVAGILISLTGVILDFPGFGQSRELMQLSEIIHAGIAMIFIAVSFGHIYIGTLGMEGAIDAMAKGDVDANWAKQHHDKWYAEMERRGKVEEAAEPKVKEEAGSPPDIVPQ